MADLTDFFKALDEIEGAVIEALPDIATLLALTAKALAERHILEVGVGATYSTNPIPVFWFEGKELNSGGENYIAAKKGKKKKRGQRKSSEDITEEDVAKGLGTWGEFREAQGLQAAFVDLHYSNKMFAGMTPGDPVKVENYVVFVPLAGSNKETVDKMNWNAEEYGDFITKALTPESKEILTQTAGEAIEDVLKRFL